MDKGIQQHVGDVVGQRAADQKLHRQIVDAFRIQAIVSAFGPDPALRQHVPDRPRSGLEALARTRGQWIDDVVEQQVPLVESVVMPGKPDRAAAILFEKVGSGF